MSQSFFESLKKARDIDSSSLDVCYQLVRETVRALSLVPESELTVADLDMLFLMTVGTWRHSASRKKEVIAASHLPPQEIERLNALLDEVVVQTKGSWGIFGASIFTFRSVGKGKGIDDAVAASFIRLCCELLDSEDEDATLDKTESVFTGGLYGIGAGTASQILHLLQPSVFPVMNDWGRRKIGELIGEKVSGGLAQYVPTVRRVRKIRDESFQFKNYLVIDQMKSGGGDDQESTTDFERNTDDDELLESSHVASASSLPMNLILYGPPGTGKTYHSTRRALELLGEKDVEKRDDKDVSELFRKRQEEGRVAFVTFHQSYGYEDFIEGIRPDLDEDEDGEDENTKSLKYKRSVGVFKKISELATNPPKTATRRYQIDRAKIRIWKMSLGNTSRPDEAHVYRECIDNGYVLLGYGQNLDYTGCDNRDAVKKKLRSEFKEIGEKDFNITEMNLFKNEMAVGDLVFVSEGNRKIRAIARVTGDYKYLADRDYGQSRQVEWLWIAEESIPAELLLRKSISQLTFYEFYPEVVKFDFLEKLLSGGDDGGIHDYVLIIDEINRGNISKIFGELITLLEPDKRLGQDNELRVTLPCSGETFAVPPNLHIIGTMNTADRSIALLDAALRRRFTFEEMMPDVKVIRKALGNGGHVEGVDVANIFETINTRIRFLYDRDHQIGHSYFMKATSLDALRRAFVDSVIPLLQEYFYGAWDKVCMVLGCPYDEKGKPSAKDARGEKITRYAEPIVTAELLEEATILGFDHEDYENHLDYRIAAPFRDGCEDAVLRKYFDQVLLKASESSPEGNGGEAS